MGHDCYGLYILSNRIKIVCSGKEQRIQPLGDDYGTIVYRYHPISDIRTITRTDGIDLRIRRKYAHFRNNSAFLNIIYKNQCRSQNVLFGRFQVCFRIVIYCIVS